MKTFIELVVKSLIAVLTLSAADPLRAQQGNLGLKHIVYANTAKTLKRPERGWADEHGGEFYVTIVRTETFTETVHVSWNFDKSVATLSAGEEFRITLNVEVSKPGVAGNDPKTYGSISNYFVEASNFTNGVPTAGTELMVGKKKASEHYIAGPVPADEEAVRMQVYARADGSNPGDNFYVTKWKSHARTGTGVYRVSETIRADRMDGFYFRFATKPGVVGDDPNQRNCNCEIAYIYETNATSSGAILTLGDGKPPKREHKGGDSGNEPANERTGNGIAGRTPPTSPWGREILPPWFPPAPGNNASPDPSTRYRPNGWSSCESDWPPFVIGNTQRRNSTKLGTPNDWWSPGQPTAFPPNCTNGGARILLAGRRRVAMGKEVTVPVYLFFPRGTAALNFEVEYDPSVVKPVDDPDRGSVFGQSVRFSGESSESGVLRIGFAQSQPISRSGGVANLRFRAVGSPGKRTDLHLQVYDLKDSSRRPLAMDLYDGEIEVVRQYRRGDTDGDNILTVFDAQRAIDMSTRKIGEDLNLDMDASGKVLATDALIILQQIDVRQNRFASQ